MLTSPKRADFGQPQHGRPAAPREAFLGRLAPRAAAAMPDVEPIHVALVNNMPDIALSRTELQFMDMLQAAACDVPIRLSLYSLPAVPRGERGRQHLAASYRPIEDLWANPPDAIVISGTEPQQANLVDECYWSALSGLIDWADSRGVPAMFSCLAAHAAVLHCDGIVREPLGAKCFGLFEHEVATESPLMRGVRGPMLLPHTRWNRVTEAALRRAGYQILSRCPVAGVGYFARQRGSSLWLFCQGHPEYDGPSLLREYKRDVLRYLKGERVTYPNLPHAYFEPLQVTRLEMFRARALARTAAGPDETIIRDFPADVPAGPDWEGWREHAVTITRNWLMLATAGAKAGRGEADRAGAHVHGREAVHAG